MCPPGSRRRCTLFTASPCILAIAITDSYWSPAAVCRKPCCKEQQLAVAGMVSPTWQQAALLIVHSQPLQEDAWPAS